MIFCFYFFSNKNLFHETSELLVVVQLAQVPVRGKGAVVSGLLVGRGQRLPVHHFHQHKVSTRIMNKIIYHLSYLRVGDIIDYAADDVVNMLSFSVLRSRQENESLRAI